MKRMLALCLGALFATVGGCSRPPTEQGSVSTHDAWTWETWSRVIPNPADSIIIESKTLNIGTGSPAAVVNVFITNKDTLANLTLALVESSLTGGAYMTLAYPRNFSGVVTPLTSTLQFITIFGGNWYNSSSPDTFSIGCFFDPRDISTFELPNLVRKAILEIKFDTVRANPTGGSLQFGTAWMQTTATSAVFTCFVDLRAHEIKPNFIDGTVNVTVPNSSPALFGKRPDNDPH